MKVRVLTPALEEITQAALWLESQAEGLGQAFWQLVDETIQKVGSDPHRFAKSEFATSEIELRYAYVSRFKHVIHFLIEPEEIAIVAVHQAARKPGYWLSRVKKT